jgi:hypothetical protein
MIQESGRPATASEGVKVLGSEGGAVVIEIGSGRYSFSSKLPGGRSQQKDLAN